MIGPTFTSNASLVMRRGVRIACMDESPVFDWVHFSIALLDRRTFSVDGKVVSGVHRILDSLQIDGIDFLSSLKAKLKHPYEEVPFGRTIASFVPSLPLVKTLVDTALQIATRVFASHRIGTEHFLASCFKIIPEFGLLHVTFDDVCDKIRGRSLFEWERV